MKKPGGALLNNLSDLVNDLQARNCRTLTYREGQMVFYENTRPMGLYLVLSGRVKTFRHTPRGSENILGISNRNSFVGMDDLLYHETYSTSAIAVEASRIIYIPKAIFLEMYSKSREDLLLRERRSFSKVLQYK